MDFFRTEGNVIVEMTMKTTAITRHADDTMNESFLLQFDFHIIDCFSCFGFFMLLKQIDIKVCIQFMQYYKRRILLTQLQQEYFTYSDYFSLSKQSLQHILTNFPNQNLYNPYIFQTNIIKQPINPSVHSEKESLDRKEKMTTTSRFSKIDGLMNSMYYLQEGKPLNERFIRMSGMVKMENDKELDLQLQQSLQSQIEINSFWAWVLLFIAFLLPALIPCWVMSGKMQFFTKNGWRFLVVAGLLIPFVMYEQRTAKKEQEKIQYYLSVQKLKPIIISGINFSIWFGLLIYACKFTSMNHALCLSCLRFFFVSLIKIRNGQKIHQFQVAGVILTFIGIILVCTDSLTLPLIFDHQTRKYLRMAPWKRFVLGDGCAILASICSVYLDQNMKVPGMPRFTYMFFYSLFCCFGLVTGGYFFGGTDFDFHTQYGIFGIFTYKNFVEVLYVGIGIGLFLNISHILVAQIFNDLVINIASNLKTIMSSMVMQALGLELIMSGLTPIGYCFVIPGMIFIVGGQGALNYKQNKLAFQLYKPPADIFAPQLLGQDNRISNSMILDKDKSILEKSKQILLKRKNSYHNERRNHKRQ